MKTVEHNYTGYGTEGKLYQATKNLSTKEIAKLIRQELKSKVFEGLKFSVRSEYNHIRVEVVDAPADFEVKNPEFEKAYAAGQCTFGISRYNDNAVALLEIIEKMLNKYNYDDSDGQIDYFSTKFYSSVSYSWERFRA